MADSLQDQINEGAWEINLPVPIPEDNYELEITDAGDPVLVKDEYQNESGTKKRLWIEFTVCDEDSDFYGYSFRQWVGFSLHAKSTLWPIVKAAAGGTVDPKVAINRSWLVGKRLQSSVTLGEPDARGLRSNRIGTPLPLKKAKATKTSTVTIGAGAAGTVSVDPDEPNF